VPRPASFHVFPDLKPCSSTSDAGSPDGTGRVVVETDPPNTRADPARDDEQARPVGQPDLPEIDGVGGKGPPFGDLRDPAALDVKAAGRRRLRTCARPPGIELLADDHQGGYDIVRPAYADDKYERTIHEYGHYPLTRALTATGPPADGGDSGSAVISSSRPRARRLDRRQQQVRDRTLR